MSNFTERGNEIQDLVINESLVQLVFPFTIERRLSENLVNELIRKEYHFFKIQDGDMETAFYGDHRVSHRALEKNFLPNIEPLLYPPSCDVRHSFRRFSKVLNLDCEMISEHVRTTFKILSIDIVICPFKIGMINLRVELPKDMPISEALEFVDIIRVMEPILEPEIQTDIVYKGKTYKKMKDFIFEEVCPFLIDYMDTYQAGSTYFGSLPFFIDERMYVVGFFALPEESKITPQDLYRFGHVNGFDTKGEPFIGASNQDYINRYIQKHTYDRWADETNYLVSEYIFACISSGNTGLKKMLASQMYGEYYYAFLLFYYYRIALMKLTYDQSQISIETKETGIEDLIVSITDFSSKFYYPEVNSRVSGREIFAKVKEIYNIEELYRQVKSTLNDLYQNQDKLTTKRNNYLLQILTTYTVISGIYGMNLVIQDWEGRIKWSKIPEYTFFEWISFLVAISGIAIGTILAMQALWNYLGEKRRRKRKIV
ncbi:hypothetical protein [Peribacillus deserti]|uniref:Group-specific protein n=1 Tax=Peribacillus deserti TaxID=673318 RepID=A0A2N5MBK1_9BACI|nr:hypothetical protein [Peribacillus deserti]PLT31742.1 hypothetical protein CUU66_00845 [Peribacillus deserti]